MNVDPTNELAAAINDATDLDSLCSALNEASGVYGIINSMDNNRLVEFSALPVFDGEEPDNTVEIYSWDSGRFLVCNSADGTWELIDRDEY